MALGLRSSVAEECRFRLSIAPVHYLRPFSGRGRCPGMGQMSEPNVRSRTLAQSPDVGDDDGANSDDQ